MNPSLKKFVSQRIVWERQHCLPRPEDLERWRASSTSRAGEAAVNLRRRNVHHALKQGSDGPLARL